MDSQTAMTFIKEMKALMPEDPDCVWSTLQDNGVDVEIESLIEYFNNEITLKELADYVSV